MLTNLKMESNNEHTFQVADWLLFAVTLISSVLIGMYFAYKDRNVKTTKNYLFGNREMSPVAVALSISVSYISAITVLGYPIETYLYGGVFIWQPVAAIIAAMFAMIYFIPLMYQLELTTIYEYLEMRFNRRIRICCSILANLHLMIYMSIAVYLPSLALTAVSPISLEWSIVITTAICTFYTTLGGMKAVIWTDVVQSLVMLIGMSSVFFRTTTLAGGLQNVTMAVERGERNNYFKVSVDPRERTSALTYLTGMTVVFLNNICTSQIQSQRTLSCSSLKLAKLAVLISCGPIAMYYILSMGIGLVMYAYNENCDPYLAGKISRHDQGLPYMVSEVFKDIPGLTGIFVSSAYSGTLSTVSSGVNAIAAVVVNDYISVIRPSLSSKMRFSISQILTAVVGCTVMALALLVSRQGDTAVTISFVADGLAGPVLGLFFLGAFIPLTNSVGALSGFVFGIAMGLWISIGGLIYGGKPEFRETLPLNIDECVHENTTFSTIIPTMMATSSEESRPIIADTWYSVAPHHIATIGFISTMLAGVIVSLITGRTKSKDVHAKTFLPLVDNILLPESVRRFFRCGVAESVFKDKEENFEENLILKL